ncbi:putative solute-binding family lipoprotein [Mycoplasma testudineum]|uniref:Putative solute-binding family lipoprotein n=1 Tax=Mycoplasma testudineum TaxID=244584 RepID=A0A4R6ID42_9MOLU|nr:hypothetical protein [Mycoplasma testudineum]OYD26612.1 hypothetical protein CG473_03190 [Mycoplasma testudineum]TDO19448.1 putative solute-binding family lipoprotein [Mycoplasma testudineum]
MSKFLSKKVLKIVGISAATLGIAGGIVGAGVYKTITPSRPVFFNFAAYASEGNIEELSQNFSYRTYTDVNDFKDQILAQRVSAGITSGYQIASMIKEGLLRQIDYDAFFNIKGTSRERGINNYDSAWAQATFTDSVYEQFSFFDSYINQVFPNQNLHLWNFMVPYYTQYKEIFYDWNDIIKTNLTQSEISNEEIDFETRIKSLDSASDGQSIENLLKVLNSLVSSDKIFSFHDEMRDNIAYGSMNLVNQDVENFDGALDIETNSKYVDNFVAQIEKGLNTGIENTSKILFSTDSQPMLNGLINPQLNIAAALIYNGDALDSFFASDNFVNYADENFQGSRNPTRSAKIKSKISLTDGLIIPKYVSEERANSNLKLIHDSFYDGWFNEDFQTLPDSLYGSFVDHENNTVNMYNKDAEEFTKSGFQNFDFVNYTPPTKIINNLVFFKSITKPIDTTNTDLYKNNYIYTTLLGYGYEEAEVYKGSDLERLTTIGTRLGILDFEGIKVPSFISPAGDAIVASAQIYYLKRLKG